MAKIQVPMCYRLPRVSSRSMSADPGKMSDLRTCNLVQHASRESSRRSKALTSKQIIGLALVMLLFLGAATRAWSYPTATLTITGAEQNLASGWDSGNITVAFNGYSVSIPYGQFATPSGIASGLAARLSANPTSALNALCTLGVCAKANGPTITFQLKGAASFGPVTVTGGSPSFSVDSSAWPPTSPVSVSVAPSVATLSAGLTQQFTATVANSSNAGVVWSISPDGSGTISSAGLYTAPASISSATTVSVTATSQASTSATASAAITLEPPLAVSVSPASTALYGGQTQQLNATVTNTSNTAVTWSISPAGTGTISSSGLYTAPASITGQATVTVTATSQANTSATASGTITLYPRLVLPAAGIINTIVGTGSVGYSGDGGVALNALLNSPTGVAVDSAGNVYIADSQNNVVRKVTASTGGIGTIAGNGTAGYSGDGGAAIAAQLYAPIGLALDSAGNLYIADTSNNVVREVNALTGIITTFAGNGIAGYSGDSASATSAELNTPTGVAVDSSGNVYVSDAQNNAIRKISQPNGVISTVAGNSIGGDSGDGGAATSAEFNFPTSVAVDTAGNLYIADSLNGRIRKVTASTGIVAAFAGQGQWGYAGDGGPAMNAVFSYPTGIAVDAAANVYIADIGNSLIRKVTASTLTIASAAGNATWGYSGDGGPATGAQLGIDQFDGIAVDASGNIFIADVDNNVIRVVGGVKTTPSITVSASPNLLTFGAVTSTVIANISNGTGTVVFSNGQGWSSAALSVTNGIATVSFNNAGWPVGTYPITASYSGDALNNAATGETTVVVNSTTKATPIVTWSAPSPIPYGTALSTIQLNATASVPGTFVYSPSIGFLPAAGASTLSVIFLPTDSSDYNAAGLSVLLTVNPASVTVPSAGLISTVAGNGITGYSGDGGLATSAELTTYQSGIAVDSLGNIYIADAQDNVVRKVNVVSWSISTVAGSGTQGYSGDQGSALSAQLNAPAGVAVDALGNIYIADTGNNVIRQVSLATGLITTVAGNYTIGYSGDGGLATQAALYYPCGISVAANGDLFISDTGNSAVRRVTAATHTIATVAGNGTSGYSGDGSLATGATLNAPTSVAIDTFGNFYIADVSNNNIRVVYVSGTLPGISGPAPGAIYTLVGTGTGVAINATLDGPQAVAVDASGNVYIADSNNNLVRAVYSSGTIPGISSPTLGSLYTLAGNGTAGYLGDGGLASNAELNGPEGVAVDAYGHVYIADTNDQVIRAVGAVGKSSSPITWPSPTAITYGTPLGGSQLNATAAIAGAMVYEPFAGTVLTVGTQPIAVTFTPTDTTDNAVVTSTTTIVVNQATPAVTWAPPSSIVPGTALSAAQLNATASVPGAFVYSPESGTMLPPGATTLTTTFIPTDTVDYTSTTASVSLTVQQLTPAITWAAPSPISYGTALSATQLNATTGIPGTFTYNVVNGTVLTAGTVTLSVTFTPTNSAGYTTAVASVPLVVNRATPVISWATPPPITYGTPLSAAQLNATASVPGTFLYSPAAGVVPSSGSNTLAATFTPSDTVNYTGSTAEVSLVVNQALSPGAPVLELRMAVTPSAVLLSDPVNLDWIVWGADGSTTTATRMAGANLISDITPLGGANISADSNGAVQYSWTGGTPIANGNNVKAEMTTTGAGTGFQITAPADATVKTLLLYVSVNPNAQLSASISDGNSAAISHSPIATQDQGYEVYSIDYRAGSAGQTLTVQLVSTDASATVGLQAAVLQPHLPEVSILAPLAGQSFNAAGVPVIVNATQFDASIASVQLISNGTSGISMSTAPYITTLNPPSGHYVLQAQATDTAGRVSISAPINFDVIGAGGSLADTFGQLSATASVDLTSEGTADWMVFGPSNYNSNQIARKSGVVPLISSSSIISAGPYTTDSFVGNGPFSFEDGTPDPRESGILPGGVVSGNSSPGFQVVVAADTTPRTLRLYSEGCLGNVMTAFLSDGSAPAITDTSQVSLSSGSSSQNFYSITFNAASVGQSLTVRQIAQGGGCVLLNAASLTGAPTQLSPMVTSVSPSSGTAGTVVTIGGTGFGSSEGSGTVSLGGMTGTVLSWSDAQIRAAVPEGVQTGPVQVTTAVGASNTNIQFALAPTVTSLSPSNGPIGTTVTITGVGFGASQGSGVVSFNGTTATPSSWSDTQIVLPVPAGSTTGTVTVAQGATAQAMPIFTVTSGTQGPLLPLIQVGLDNSPKTVNLAEVINQDWVAYSVGSSQVQFTCGAQSANGSSCSQSGSGFISVTPLSSGFQMSAPADTTVRTLKIYSSYTGFDALSVSISDGSSMPVSFTPQATYDYGERVFSVDYRAASSGQIVTVLLTAAAAHASDARLSVEAVVLQPHLPAVSILSPLTGQIFRAQTSVPLGVDAMQFDSAISSGSVSLNGSPLYSFNAPAYAATWTPPQGHYVLQAKATDAAGLTNTSKPVYLDMIGTGGTLVVSKSLPPAVPIDLTSVGTADWIMFEDCSNQADAGPVRKVGVLPLISTFSVVGDQPNAYKEIGLNAQYFDPSGFAYHDGTPDVHEASTSCSAELANGVPGNGFEVKVKADATPRTLRLYVGTYRSRGKLTVFLSDGSAPVVIDSSVVPNQDDNTLNGDYAAGVYAINFSAATPGQTLTARWVIDDVIGTYSYVGLFAASLDGTPIISGAGPTIVNMTPTSGGVGSVVTITGSGFGSSQGSSTVTFNGVAAAPITWSDTQIQVPVPAPDNPGDVLVTVSGIASDPEFFSMPPHVTGLSSSSGVVGSTLTISGFNFGPSQGSVYIGNSGASVLSWTDTQIQIVVPICSPSCAGSLIVNSNTGIATNSVSFATIPTQITPTILWQAPAAIAYGTPLSATQLNAAASVPGTFVYSPALATALSAGTYTLAASFVPTDTTSYTGATAQVSLVVTQLTPVVSWAAPSPITYGTPLSSVQLNATASVPGIFVYNPPIGAVLSTGTDTLSATFIPTDGINYATATANVNLGVTGGRGIEIPPPGMISTIGGNGTAGNLGDSGQAANAELNSPFGVAVDSSGNVFIADTLNNVVREINASTGVISTVAGNYASGYSGDGALGVNAELNGPYGVAVDTTGNLYIADTGNDVIRQVSASTGIISTIVGDGTGRAAYTGDGGPASGAELNSPTGVAVDLTGNIYIADWMNSAIREVNASTGIIATIAGDGTGKAAYLGDGGLATSAELNQPFGIAVDLTSGNATSGNIYIADSSNNRVRMLSATTHIITTVAGTGVAGYGGDNGVATSALLANPLGVAVDASGNLFIADYLNNVIREVGGSSNIITTVAGSGLAGDSGDGGQGVNAKLNGPASVATDALVALGGSQPQNKVKAQAAAHTMAQSGCGSAATGGNDVYVIDTGNNASRLLGNPTLNTPPFLVPPGQSLAWAYPSSSSDSGDAVDATTGSSASGSFYGAGSITWTGFTMPPLPSNAVIQGVYAVEGYDATCLGGLSATLTGGGTTLSPSPSNGIGVSHSQTLGISLPGSMTAAVTGSGEGSLDITSAAAAVLYTLTGPIHTPGGGGCIDDTSCCPPAGGDGTCVPSTPVPTFTALALVDPYLLYPYHESGNMSDLELIDPNVVIAGISSAAAMGFIADGTSTAIAVVKIDVHGGPAPTGTINFQVDNGATLAPYSPSFLVTAPGPASTSITGTVTIPVGPPFIQNGGFYYALALVTAGTRATSSIWANTTVSVPSLGIQFNGLTTYPAPTVLIHGLWGGLNSLSTTTTYLESLNKAASSAANSAPQVRYQVFTQPICYGKTYAFNEAVRSSAKNNPQDCENNTPSGALYQYMTDLYSSLDEQGVVGGRVDVVAHSMGGLLTRFFYQTVKDDQGYSASVNPRNRAQGAFRDVVTLDTPETGSALASWIKNYFGGMHGQGRLFFFYCVIDTPHLTVAQCLDKRNRPVAPLDALIPGLPPLQPCVPGTYLTNCLPNPNLPNAIWYAVAGQSDDPTAQQLIDPKKTQQGNSLDRNVLSAFLGSTYPAKKSQLSWNYLQANVYNGDPVSAQSSHDFNNVTPVYDLSGDAQHNDVIVVQKSALNDAGLLGGDLGGPAEQYTPSGLAHNPVPSSLSLLGLRGSSNSVTTDNCVTQYVAMWLGYQTTVGSCAAAPAVTQAEQPLTKAEAWILDANEEQLPAIEANDRVSIDSPSQPITLGQPVHLKVNVTRSDLVSLSIEQTSGTESYDNVSIKDGNPVGGGEAKFVRDDGISKEVEVVPLQVGQVSFQITAAYADGGIARQEYVANVGPSSEGVRQFLLNRGSSTLSISLTSGSDDPHSKLIPMIEYDTLQYPIYLKGFDGITLSVEQPAIPVVQVDNDGTVHALRPGSAVIRGELGGVKDQVIVKVHK